MPSSAEADAGSGRVTRSLRKRLVSIDSDASSRPGTPIANSLLTIPETGTPAKRTTRRTSLSTPVATPTKARGRLDINEQINTPSRRSTRRRSTSVQEVEDFVAQNKSKEPSINVVKEEDTTERTPEPQTKRVTRSSSKSPLEQILTQPKALKSPKHTEQQVITIDDSLDESPALNATPLGSKKRTKVNLKKEHNIEEMMIESKTLEESGHKKVKKKTDNEGKSTPSKTTRKSSPNGSNKKANSPQKSSPTKKEVEASAQKGNISPNQKQQSDVEKSAEKKKQPTVQLISSVSKRLSVDVKKTNFSNVENFTSSNSQPKQSTSTKVANAIPPDSDTPRAENLKAVEQSKPNGNTSRKNLSLTMDVLSSPKSSTQKKTPAKVSLDLDMSQKKKSQDNGENSSLTTDVLSSQKSSPRKKTPVKVSLNLDVSQKKKNEDNGKNISAMDVLSSPKPSPRKKTPANVSMDLDVSQKKKNQGNEQSNFEEDILSLSVVEKKASEPSSQQKNEEKNHPPITEQSSSKIEVSRTSEIKNMTTDVTSSPSKPKKSPNKKNRPDQIKSVAFNETADEETIKSSFPKTPGLTKSKSYILEASHDAEMETSYKSTCNTVPPVSDVDSKLDKEDVNNKDDVNDNEEVVDGKTPYKLKLKAVESSTPITNASPKKKASSLNKKSTEEHEESGNNSFPRSWSHSVLGKVEDKIDRIEKVDLSHDSNRSKDLSNGKRRSIKASFDGSSDEDDDIIADDVFNEDALDGEEQAQEKSFFDDEAMEVPEGEESMEPEERAYLEENEVPVYGESIGSEDSENEYSGEEEEEYEDDGFVVSDTEEVALAVDESDSDVENNRKRKGKKFQRIVQFSDSSNEANDLRTEDKPCLVLESSEDEEDGNSEKTKAGVATKSSLNSKESMEQSETANKQETSIEKESETSATSSQNAGETKDPFNEDYKNMEMEEAEAEIKQWNISLPKKSANGKIEEVELVATPSKDNISDESRKASNKERKSLQKGVKGTSDLESETKTDEREIADATRSTNESRKSLNKSGEAFAGLDKDSKNNTSEMQHYNVDTPESVNVVTEENAVKSPNKSSAKKQRSSLNNRSVSKTVETNDSEKEDQSLKEDNVNKSTKETRKSVNKGSELSQISTFSEHNSETETAPKRKSMRKDAQEIDETTGALDHLNGTTEEEGVEPLSRSQTKKERRPLNSSSMGKSAEGTTDFTVEEVRSIDLESNALKANTPIKDSRISMGKNRESSPSQNIISPKRKSVNGNERVNDKAAESSPSQKALRKSLTTMLPVEDLEPTRKEKKSKRMPLHSSRSRKLSSSESDAEDDNAPMEINTSTSRKQRKSITRTSTEEENKEVAKLHRSNAQDSSEPEETLSASEAPSETSGRKSLNSSRRSRKSLNKSQASLDSEEDAPLQENDDQIGNDEFNEPQQMSTNMRQTPEFDSDAETSGEASENDANDGSVNGEEEDKSSTGEEEEAAFSDTEVDAFAAERSSIMEFLGEEECESPSKKKTKHNLSRRKSLNQSKFDETFDTNAQRNANNRRSIMEKSLNQSQLRKRSIQVENIQKDSEGDESNNSNNSSDKDFVKVLKANDLTDRGLSLSLSNIEVQKKKLRGGEKAIRNSFTIGVSVRASFSDDSSASSPDSSEKNEPELSEQEELEKVKDVLLVEPYKSRHSLLPLKCSTIKTKEQKRIKRTSLYEQEQEASQSFVENIAKEKKKAESKEKRLSNSFCGVKAPSVENADQPEMPKSEKKSKQPPESADKNHIQHILSRCDEILEAANRAKLQAKLNAKKIKPKKQKSINKEMKTKKEEEEVKIPLVSQKELKRKEKIKKELAKAMKHSAAMLTAIDPKLGKKLQSTQKSETEADKNSVSSKRLPVELLNALEETPRPKKKKLQEITPPSDKENSKKSSNKAGFVIEDVPSVKKQKKPKREILETATGTVIVEPATPEKLRFQHGFHESPKTPAGFKVQSIQSAGRNEKKKHGKCLFTASGEFVENDVSFSEDKTNSNTKPKRKRKHIEEPMYSLPKTQWTSSGVFVEEDLFTARPLANSTATQFIITSLKSNKKSKNCVKPVSSTSLEQALNFKQSALFNQNVRRETSRNMLQSKERKLANNQY